MIACGWAVAAQLIKARHAGADNRRSRLREAEMLVRVCEDVHVLLTEICRW